MSNFLGDPGKPEVRSAIISTNEMVVREGEMFTQGMNFRDSGESLSVFLVLEREDGLGDQWDQVKQIYSFQGHDSTTVEGGKETDQLLMYQSGKPTENGLFYKAAHAYKDGTRRDPLQIQVYEKLEMGAWFDKGIFNLVDARKEKVAERAVYLFSLCPADAELDPHEWDEARRERLIPAKKKSSVWARDNGRCTVCGSEVNLHFDHTRGRMVSLKCGWHMSAV